MTIDSTWIYLECLKGHLDLNNIRFFWNHVFCTADKSKCLDEMTKIIND